MDFNILDIEKFYFELVNKSMSYSSASKGNVTMIGDLPELRDLENGDQSPYPSQHPSHQMNGGILSPEMAQKLRRHVRDYRNVPSPEAGMSMYGPQQPQEEYIQTQQQPPQQVQPAHNPALTGISCLDIASHVKDCPICSKFYNNDKTTYIIVIVMLALICLLLLKKVLNV